MYRFKSAFPHQNKYLQVNRIAILKYSPKVTLQLNDFYSIILLKFNMILNCSNFLDRFWICTIQDLV